MKRSLPLIALLLCALAIMAALAGCGSGSGTGAAGTTTIYTAKGFFVKKAVGNTWTWNSSTTVTASPGAGTYPGSASLTFTASSGAGVTFLSTSSSGAITTSATGWMGLDGAENLVTTDASGNAQTMLPATFSVGTTYTMTPATASASAQTATIAAINITRTVPAGTFTDVIQVNTTQTSTIPAGITTTTTIYLSPSAGNFVEVSATAASGAATLYTGTSQLQSYTAN